MHPDFLGTLAGSLTTFAFLPQVLKVIRTRSTHDLSLVMFVIFSVGVALWLLYGLIISSWPIIVANAVTLALCSVILSYKLRYG